MNGELRALMRYRSALGFWYARMFAAARDGREFNEQRPEPSDFIAAIDAALSQGGGA